MKVYERFWSPIVVLSSCRPLLFSIRSILLYCGLTPHFSFVLPFSIFYSTSNPFIEHILWEKLFNHGLCCTFSNQHGLFFSKQVADFWRRGKDSGPNVLADTSVRGHLGEETWIYLFTRRPRGCWRECVVHSISVDTNGRAPKNPGASTILFHLTNVLTGWCQNNWQLPDKMLWIAQSPS